MAAPPVQDFRGREQERQLLDGMLAKVRGGESAALVLRGEAGIGKTALLRYCAGQASGFEICQISGVESEMELPFAGLHQLCSPLLSRLAMLPEPQAAALTVAFGLATGAVPDRFVIALGALGLLSEAALTRPLLCLVDDAQWLDGASRQVLGFIARRLMAESLSIVFAVREASSESELAGLPELWLAGLADKDARALLALTLPGRLDERVRDRFVAETRGNPLALLELSPSLISAQLAGGFGLPGARALSGRIEESFVQRLDAVSEPTRLLLLVAAADPVGDALLVWRAAERLGISPGADTEMAGWLAIEERVTFRHPLVRSAVYRSATAPARREVHLALAAETDPHIDPDRRAWHLAVAASGPDEAVASELEQSADRAKARGGIAAAAAFLQRSAVLTADPARRVDRALAAALANLHAGAFDVAYGLLAAAEAGAPDEFQGARIDLLRGLIAAASGTSTDVAALLLKAGQRLEPLDLNLARETYLDAWGAAFFAGRYAEDGDLRQVCQAAQAAPEQPGAPGPSDVLLNGLAVLVVQGCAAAATTLRAAIAGFLGDGISVEKGLQWSALAGVAGMTLWDYESFDAVISRQLELSRNAGALAALAFALNGRGIVESLAGNFAGAALAIAEATVVTQATGTRIAPYGAMLLEAYRGREADATQVIETTKNSAIARGEGFGVEFACWATAVLNNGLGRYEVALHGAQQALGDAPGVYPVWVLPELIEAAVRSGQSQIAADAIVRLAESAQAGGTEWAQGILARSQALLAEGDAAEALFRTAIACLGGTRLRPDLARAHLLFGEWLRRENRRVDARDELRVAHDMFLEVGMDGFASRARHELLATGEKVRKRQPDTVSDLTPQESHIARLAADGWTNPEIGAQLFISARTVEWHLRKVFTKVGVTSRRGLRDTLPVAAPH
jgi:DNA-binding CsgD family transcriptional regulator